MIIIKFKLVARQNCYRDSRDELQKFLMKTFMCFFFFFFYAVINIVLNLTEKRENKRKFRENETATIQVYEEIVALCVLISLLLSMWRCDAAKGANSN